MTDKFDSAARRRETQFRLETLILSTFNVEHEICCENFRIFKLCTDIDNSIHQCKPVFSNEA